MKVIIDPIVKQLFFDRIQETYGNHSAMFWIENVAYGNTPVILQDELVSLMETLENTKKEKRGYKQMYLNKRTEYSTARNELDRMRIKIRTIENEIESYVDEIKEYRDILTAKGLQEYVSEYDDQDF